jgi:hypothetical protein
MMTFGERASVWAGNAKLDNAAKAMYVKKH